MTDDFEEFRLIHIPEATNVLVIPEWQMKETATSK